MTTELPDFGILLARTIIYAALVVTYGYDWVRLIDLWRDQHDRRHWSTLRALIKSSVLMLVLVILFTGSLNVTFFNDSPLLRDGIRFLGYVLIGPVLVGGVALCWSWVREGKEVPLA